MGEKIRQSNMELLRLVAMFLILLLHANNTVFNYLTPETVLGSPGYALPFLGIESLANVGVDVFVLISGWFGIKARLRGGMNILFQPVYYSIIFLVFCLLAGIGSPLHPKSLAGVFLFTKYYWYVKAYIGLYILSPILNSFVEHASRKQFFVVLVLFYTLQTVYGCSDSSPDFYLGYSIITFCGLYLLGRYLNLYGTKIKEYRAGTYLTVYLLVTILLTFLVFVSFRIDSSGFMKRSLYSYCDPLVVIQSVAILLMFNRFNFSSKVVNMAAVSCLSVYLIHENINIQWYYRSTANDIFTNWSFAISLVILLGFILAVFVASIIFDQIRLFVWRNIEKHIPDVSINDLK